jgi:hypothetical protein
MLFAPPHALPTVEEFLHAQHLRVSFCDMVALSIAFDSRCVKFCDSSTWAGLGGSRRTACAFSY